MATIKLQPSGAVVLKDGKVACTCCATACCPYPAQALVDGLYTYEDLPDAIDIDSIEFTKLDPPQFIEGVNQYYINTNGEYLGIESMPSDSVWAYEGGNNACLLNDSGWEDQFANSYTVTDNILGYLPSPVTVNRIGLCQWQASFAGTLYFGNPDYPPANGNWIVNINTFIIPFEVIYYWQNLENPDDFYYPNQQWTFRKNGPPTEPNSSPSGSYSAGHFGSISVS